MYGLSGPDHHSHRVVSVNSVKHAVVFDIVALHLQLGSLVKGAVETCGFEVCVDHLDQLAVDIDDGPHGTVVRFFEVDGLVLGDRITAVDDHVAASHRHIWEVLFIAVGVLLVAANVVVLLHAENVNFLLLHVCQDVLCDKSCGLAVEPCHVVGSYLQSRLLVGLFVYGAKLVECADVGNAAEQSNKGNSSPVPAAAYEPVEEHDGIANDE